MVKLDEIGDLTTNNGIFAYSSGIYENTEYTWDIWDMDGYGIISNNLNVVDLCFAIHGNLQSICHP